MDLVVEDAAPGKVNALWGRRQNTFFNGASNIVQLGALSVFTEDGERECREMIAYYMENARIIRTGLESLCLTVFGGVHAPYLWVKTPGGMSSWDFFDKLLSEAHVVGTPGSGFGPAGEGYFRLSAFGHRENIEQAVASIQGEFAALRRWKRSAVNGGASGGKPCNINPQVSMPKKISKACWMRFMLTEHAGLKRVKRPLKPKRNV